jgi:hypothetical protein
MISERHSGDELKNKVVERGEGDQQRVIGTTEIVDR